MSQFVPQQAVDTSTRTSKVRMHQGDELRRKTRFHPHQRLRKRWCKILRFANLLSWSITIVDHTDFCNVIVILCNDSIDRYTRGIERIVTF